MKAVCFSVAALDYFPGQDLHFAGGNALNQAIRFRKAGVESAFAGALGTDGAGDRIAGLLASAGVDCSHLYRVEGETANNRIVNDEAGERFGVDGAWKDGVYGSYRMSEPDWAFLAGFSIWATHANGPDYREALERKGAGRLMAVDFLHFTTYELLEEGRKAVDIAYFGGVPEQEPELREFSLRFPGIIVLTLGAGGSLAFRKGEVWRKEALPAETVLDTTGCGDAFQAAFTLEYVRTGDPRKALAAGARGGREALGHYGGVPWS